MAVFFFQISDRYTGDPAVIWLQFQTAAGTVTSLYRGMFFSLFKKNISPNYFLLLSPVYIGNCNNTFGENIGFLYIFPR